jgi:hypothetical protein
MFAVKARVVESQFRLSYSCTTPEPVVDAESTPITGAKAVPVTVTGELLEIEGPGGRAAI